ncbi:Dynein regulatory complex subunit 6 [Frankliniella fusca]|uniref:Dynein regulatory complex subunit 6 n=1 Tax=Frankliniella fusca TaxID=407009 RepID=A0AAE1HDF0_9NEOP|nr:Dynein regulatory complex subunit 6 [Frankliniella fusca]
MTGDTYQKNEEERSPQHYLPIEVLMYIFQFLHLSDLKSARLVCRLWYEASQDPKLISKEIVNFHCNDDNQETHQTPVSEIVNSSREFLHFSFKEEEVRWNWPGVWQQFAPGLKSLYIFNCDVRERDFISILSLCQSLENLRIGGCRELLMSGGLLRDQEEIKLLQNVLVNLKELVISHNSYLSDALLNRLIAIAPNLQSVSLEGCQISFHLGLYKKFYPKHSPEKLNFDEGNDTDLKVMESSSILTFRNILHHIMTMSQQLHTLCFSHTLIDSPALTQLSKVADLRLKNLMLAGCEQLTNAGVVALTEHQTGLISLDLSCCSRVTDPSMIAICRSLSSLQNLCVRRCRAISNIGVSEIQALKHLVKLDLSNCDMVTSDGILTGLCHSVNYTLQQLYLSGINNMTEDTVIKLAESLPNLTHLDLGYCITAVTDAALQAIFLHQVQLKYLKLSGCNRVTDVGLTGMVTHSTMDVTSTLNFIPEDSNFIGGVKPRLRISLKSRAEEEIVKDAERKKAILQRFEFPTPSCSNAGYSLARLKGLRTLNLSGCTRISDITLCHAFKFLELKSLDLTQCCQVSQLGIKALAENNPSLETLVLSMCYSICDEAIEAISIHLKRLKHLDVSECQKLTGASLLAIGTHCKSLRHLNMRRCDRLALCQEGLLDHIPSVILPPAVANPEEDLSPPPPVPQMPKKKN